MLQHLATDLFATLATFVDLRHLRGTCRALRAGIPRHLVPLRLCISAIRVSVGQLDWIVREHAAHTAMLEIHYGVFEDHAHYSRYFLELLTRFSALRSLRLVLDNAAIDVRELVARLDGLVHLHELDLDLSLRTDLHLDVLHSVWRIAVRCQRVRLHLCMSDVQDAALWTLNTTCQRTPPAWTHLHLSLKHNLITDTGVNYLQTALRCARSLRILHVNLSYNAVTTGRPGDLLTALPQLRRCTLKMDSDVASGPAQRLPAVPPGLRAFSASIAFATGLVFDHWPLGVGLRSLALDLESSVLGADAGRQLGRMLGTLAGQLERLVLHLVHTGIDDAGVVDLLRLGIAPMRRLERLVFNLTGNRCGDAAVVALVDALPPTVRHLRLDVGGNPTLRCIRLGGLTRVRYLLLSALHATLVTLELPPRLRAVVVDLDGAVLDTPLSLPPAALHNLGLRLSEAQLNGGLPPLLDSALAPETVMLHAAHLPPGESAAVLRVMAAAPSPCLTRLDVEVAAVTPGCCAALCAVMRAHAATLRRITLVLQLATDAVLADLLSPLSQAAHLESLRLQPHLDAHVGLSVGADALVHALPHVAHVHRLWLDLKLLPVSDADVAAVAALGLRRSAAGHWTEFGVDGAHVGPRSCGVLRSMASAPRCRVHILSSPFISWEAEALRLASSFL